MERLFTYYMCYMFFFIHQQHGLFLSDETQKAHFHLDIHYSLQIIFFSTNCYPRACICAIDDFQPSVVIFHFALWKFIIAFKELLSSMWWSFPILVLSATMPTVISSLATPSDFVISHFSKLSIYHYHEENIDQANSRSPGTSNQYFLYV